MVTSAPGPKGLVTSVAWGLMETVVVLLEVPAAAAAKVTASEIDATASTPTSKAAKRPNLTISPPLGIAEQIQALPESSSILGST